MNKNELHIRYGHDHWAIEIIGKIPLDTDISMSKLGKDNRAMALIQRSYKEMRLEHFDGSIIDYICYISTAYIIEEISKVVKPGEDILNGEKIANILAANNEDGRNMLRLFVKNPIWFFKLLGIKPDKKIYLNLVGYWFDFYEQDNRQKLLISKG